MTSQTTQTAPRSPAHARSVRSLLCATVAAAAVAAMLAVVPPRAAAAQSALPEGAIAVIGKEVVSENDFVAYLHGYARNNLYHGGSAEQLQQLADKAMTELIDERLVLQEVELRGLKGNPAEAEAEIEALRAQYGKSDAWKNFEAQLGQIRHDLTARTKVKELRAIIETVAEPDAATVRAYYTKHPEQFTEPPSFEVDVIVIGAPPSGEKDLWAEAEKKAYGISEELRHGGDFAALAQTHSADVSRENGGSLGRVHSGQLSPEAEKAILATPAGGYTAPVRMLEGFSIFRVIKQNPERRHAFEDVSDRAKRLYMRDAAARQWADFIMGLRRGATVTVGDLAAVSARLADATGN